jgi:arsenate reductase
MQNNVALFFSTTAKKFHQIFPDPAKATGSEGEIKAQFRQVRQQIKDYCLQFVTDNL